MEKRIISVFIGRTIFFTSEKLSIRFLSLVKKIVFLFCSHHGRRVGEGAKGHLAFMSKEEGLKSPIKKHEMKRTALTHFLGEITEKQMV